MANPEVKKVTRSLMYPALFVFACVVVWFIEVTNNLDFARFGIYPRTLEGSIGIILTPFIHGDWQHLMANSIPLLILGALVFYFYKDIALRVVIMVYLLGGLWTWVGARDAYHIGASGVIYGLVSFLFISGFIRKEKISITLALLVTFVYGYMVWGVLPVEPGISWEGHLWGAISGVVAGVYYRKENQFPRKKYSWELMEEMGIEEVYETEFWKEGSNTNLGPEDLQVKYHYKKKPD